MMDTFEKLEQHDYMYKAQLSLVVIHIARADLTAASNFLGLCPHKPQTDSRDPWDSNLQTPWIRDPKPLGLPPGSVEIVGWGVGSS